MTVTDEIKDTLVKARALISDPSHWTQGTLARDKKGFSVHELSENATCWCMLGAVSKIAEDRRKHRSECFNILKSLCDGAVFNDSHTHAEVLAVFDKAIEAVS